MTGPARGGGSCDLTQKGNDDVCKEGRQTQSLETWASSLPGIACDV